MGLWLDGNERCGGDILEKNEVDSLKSKYDYDPETDSITVTIGAQKPDITIELTENLLIDITNDWRFVGLEILSASVEISKIFNRAVSKEEIAGLLCEIKQEPKNEYLIQFKSTQKNESANLLIPLYRSPVTA
ncbi:MAG: DUF2283 domain-containing protein [Candidatus Micrarchaeia archaeon]